MSGRGSASTKGETAGRGNQSKGSSLLKAAQGGRTTQGATTTTSRRPAAAGTQAAISGPTDYSQKSGGGKQTPSLITAPKTNKTEEGKKVAAKGTKQTVQTQTPDHGSEKIDREVLGASKNIQDHPTSIFKYPSILQRLNATTNSDNNKRRGRSYSPLPATNARHQYSQDIRLSTNTGLSSPLREGPVAKWQGSGSPDRKGKGDDDSNEGGLMNDHSPIQSVEGDAPLDVQMGLGNEKMAKSSMNTLDDLKILFTGRFNTNLDDWREDVVDHGGTVTNNFEVADIAVIGDQPDNKGMKYLQHKGIPCLDLAELERVVDGETLDTPKVSVSFSEDLLRTPSTNRSKRTPSLSNSTTSQRGTPISGDSSRKGWPPRSQSPNIEKSLHGMPARIPIGGLRSPPSSISMSSISAAGQSASPQGEGGSKPTGIKHTVGTAPSKVTSILNVKITFSQTEDPKETIQASICGLLRMFQKHDKTTKIRHLKKPNAAISTQADVPSMRALYSVWAHFNNAQPSDLQPYQNAQQDRKRSVNFTIIIGSSTPMQALLDRSVWDRDEVVDGGSIHIEIKALQEVETEKAFILIATPTFCSEEILTQVFRKMLQYGITTAKKKNPGKYKALPDHIPPFALQSDFIMGIPWKKEEAADKDKIKPFMKKPFQLMTKTTDYESWKTILGLVERTDNLKSLFGGGAFIINNRDQGLGKGNRSDEEVTTLEECLRRHIWAQKNTAQLTVRGARKSEVECRIRKAVTDEFGHLCNGETDGYQIDQQMSLREIMMKIKVRDIPVFLLIANRDGKTIAFYRNTYEDVKVYAQRFESEPAGHIMHYLLRRGIERDDIMHLLKVAFSEEEAAGALETKMEGGRVISQRTMEREKHISNFDRLNPEVDITQGMRQSEIIEYENKQAIIALRDAAFHGKSNLELGEKNRFLDGEGTVYTRRDETLGETEFGYQQDDNWGVDEEEDDDEDFKKQEWDEDKLNLVRVDMGNMFQRDNNDEMDTSAALLQIEDQEPAEERGGEGRTSTNNMERNSEPEGGSTDEIYANEKYPESPAHDGAGGSGEETK